MEFNPAAEKYFGKKRKDTLNQNFIQLFVAEPLQKKTEKDMNILLNNLSDGTFKMQLIIAGGNKKVVEWSVKVIPNNLNLPVGIFIVNKNMSRS